MCSAVIIGAGLMGQWHARAAERAGARLAGVVDPDPTRGRAIAGGRRGCVVSDSVDHLPAIPSGAVAHICTPTPTHAAVVRASLARGWHVLVEKPLAENALTTEALLAQASERGLLLCPVHQFLFQRGLRAVLSRRYNLGEIVHVRATVASAGAANRPTDADAIAFEILPHPLSILERLAPGVLDRTRWQAVHPRPGEVAIIGETDSLVVTIEISMHARPTVNEITIAGARASAHVDLFHGFAVVESGVVSRRRKIAQPFGRAAAAFTSAGTNLAHRTVARQSAYPGLWELVKAFYKTAATGGQPPITAAETMAVARAMDASRAAARP